MKINYGIVWILPVVLGVMGAGFARAAVPESVAVRRQAPEVEAIIGAMEAKARAAAGTWQTRSGRQGGQGEVWTTGISGDKAWYWASDAQPPAPSAGYALYDDGEDAFLLPYGPNLREGGLRFQYDFIRENFAVDSPDGPQDYMRGYYLLHMNLLPRQFIGALGGLSKIGEESLAGNQVIHLRADPSLDELAKDDPALNRKLGKYPKNTLDFYFDPQRRAVVKLIVNTKAVVGQDQQVEIVVSDWNAFGTAETWPATFMSRQTMSVPNEKADQPGRIVTAGKITTTTVDKFTPGRDKKIVFLLSQVQSCDLFLTPVPAMRTAAFYRQALTLHENTHDHAPLAWLSFLENDVQEGLMHWNRVEQSVQSPESRQRLNTSLAQVASAAIAKVSGNHAEEATCAAVLSHITHTLRDENFRDAADGSERAWESLRRSPGTQPIIAPLTPLFLSRCAQTSSVFVLARLIQLANENTENAAVINPPLRAVFDSPVPGSGLHDSRQDSLLASALRAEDLPRAEEYLLALRWEQNASADQIQIATTWREAFSAARGLRAGRDESLPAAIADYRQFSSYRKNPTDLVYGQRLLTMAGADFLSTRINATDKLPAPALITQTASVIGAAEYWHTVIITCAKPRILQPESIDPLARLVRICVAAFKQPAFESTFWMELARDTKLRGKHLDLQAYYAVKAIKSAGDDASRVPLIQGAAQFSAAANRYSEAAQFVESETAGLRDGGEKQQMLKLAAVLKSRAAELPTGGSQASQPAAGQVPFNLPPSDTDHDHDVLEPSLNPQGGSR